MEKEMNGKDGIKNQNAFENVTFLNFEGNKPPVSKGVSNPIKDSFLKFRSMKKFSIKDL